MNKNVITFCEDLDLLAELILGAKEVASKLGGEVLTAIVGSKIEEEVKRISKYGVKVLAVDNSGLEPFDAGRYGEVLEQLAMNYSAELIMLGSTTRGRDVAGSLAAKLDTGCVTEVFKIDFEPEMTFYRSIYATAIAKEVIASSPKVITVKPKTWAKPETREGGQIEKVSMEVEPSRIVQVSVKPKEVIAERIEDAEVAVVGGKGIEKKEDLEMLRRLAAAWGGKGGKVGVTRPLAADYKWMPEWVGMSGVAIKPKLYVGVGISGQPQHTVGIRDSKIVVTINKDPKAPLFEVADYGIVGDLYQALPLLIEKSKK
jgi:electron transfer flavoprotein alpha subunit